MIKIFNATDTDFSSNGEIVINPLKCIETKKKSLNGWYIDVEIPIKYLEYIVQDKLCVVKVKSKLKPQAFRIGNIDKTERVIKFQAEHVMFDSRDYFLLDVRPTNLGALNTLAYINERTDNVSPFVVSSDVGGLDTCYFIRKNLLDAWSTIEERFGGSFDADNFNIQLKQNVGIDRGEMIVYGKNQQHIRIYEDWSSVVTKICPVGKDGMLLPETYISSDVQYEKPYTKTISFETNLDQEEQIESNLILELREKANAYIEENKYPKVSYEVKADLNELTEIGDIIHVKNKLVNLDTEVLEYQYNIISNKLIEIIFGNFTRDIKKKFDAIKDTQKILSEKISNQEKVVNEQTNIINNLNKLGTVYIDDNEILILDTLPKEEARNVLKIGLGGIGFSENGFEGPFESAWTLDGVFNADRITTGTMSVERIQGLNQQLSVIVSDISNLNITEKTAEGTNIILTDSAEQIAEITKIEGETKQINKIGYIRDGLLLHYDGYDSENYSVHNSNTSTNKAIWKDLSGNSRNGTLANFDYSGSSGWGTKGLTLDGINDYVEAPNTNNFSSDFTIEINVKSPASVGSYIIYSIGATTGKMFLFFRSTGNITLGSNSPIDGIRWEIASYTINTNYNIVIKRISGQIKIYINNIEYIPTTINNNYFVTALNSVIISDKIYLGVYNSASSFSLYLFSYIYGFKIYNRALSTTESTNNYNIDVSRFVNNDILTYSVYNTPCLEYPSKILNASFNLNLFNRYLVNGGYFINYQTGGLVIYSTAYYSDYIEIKASTNYIFTDVEDKTNCPYAWYDENKIYISGGLNVTNSIIAPSNAKYLRFTINSSLNLSKILLEEGSIAKSKNYIKLTSRGENLFNKYGDLSYGTINRKTILQTDGTLLSTANFANNRSSGQLLTGLKQNTLYRVTGKLKDYSGNNTQQLAAVDIVYDESKRLNSLTIYELGEFSLIFDSGIKENIWISLNGYTTVGSNASAIFEDVMVVENSIGYKYNPTINIIKDIGLESGSSDGTNLLVSNIRLRTSGIISIQEKRNFKIDLIESDIQIYVFYYNSTSDIAFSNSGWVSTSNIFIAPINATRIKIIFRFLDNRNILISDLSSAYLSLEERIIDYVEFVGEDVQTLLPDDFILGSVSNKILPDDYKQVEYIESTGTQYIDTNYKPNNNTRIVMDFEVVDPATTNFFFGSRIVSPLSENFCFLQANSKFRTDFGTTQLPFNEFTSLIIDYPRFLIDKNRNVTYINGLIYTNTIQNFTGTRNLILFGVDSQGTIIPGIMKCYYTKIYSNDILIRNLIPCYRKSDNVIGMYDLLNNVFYTNAGTGNFLKGSDINEYVKRDLIENNRITQNLGKVNFTGKTVTISDIKPNGAFLCTHGGYLDYKTINLIKSTTDIVTVIYEKNTSIEKNINLNNLKTYKDYNVITSLSEIKPKLYLKYINNNILNNYYLPKIQESKLLADNANNLLSDIANDSKLTASEKQKVNLEIEIIKNEKIKLIEQANKYDVDITKYITNYDYLINYITILLENLNETSDIESEVFKINFKNYYDSKQDLLNSIENNINLEIQKNKSDILNIQNSVSEIKINSESVETILKKTGGNNLIKNSAMKNGTAFWLEHLKMNYITSDTPPTTELFDGKFWYCTKNIETFEMGNLYLYNSGNWTKSQYTKKYLDDTNNLMIYTSQRNDDDSRKNTISNSIIKFNAGENLEVSHIFNASNVIDVVKDQEYVTLSFKIKNSMITGVGYVALGFLHKYLDESSSELLYSIYEPSFLFTPDEVTKDGMTEIVITTKIPKKQDFLEVIASPTSPIDTSLLWLDTSVMLTAGILKEYKDGLWVRKLTTATCYDVQTRLLYPYRQIFDFWYQIPVNFDDFEIRCIYPAFTMYPEFIRLIPSTSEPTPFKGAYWLKTDDNIFRAKYNNDNFESWLDTGISTTYLYTHTYPNPPFPSQYGVPIKGYYEVADIKAEWNNINTIWNGYFRRNI